MSKLAGKVAVITGGTSGIGLATAQKFKAEGAQVITNARHEQRREETLAAHSELFDDVFLADVAQVADLDRFFKQVGEKYGKVDVLFLNAGKGTPGPIEHVSEEDFDQEFGVNVKGVFFSVQKALPFLSEGSSIILNSSVANQLGMAGFSVYSATKGAVKTLAKAFSAELIPKKIRVNAVSPGPIETPFFSKTGMSEEQINEAASSIQSQVPMGRFGKSEEVANYVTFLASDESSYIIGTELEVDGGMATL